MAFVHLHTHTEFSLLDGLSRVRDLVRSAYADGASAVAITDHGSLGGTYELVKECRALHADLVADGTLNDDDPLPVTPILGIEFYVAIGSRHDKTFITVPADEMAVEDSEGNASTGSKFKRYEHLTVLAKNETGWKNLLALHRKSYDTYWYKPRIDFDLLKEHGDGLIVLSGCLGGPVAGPLSRGDIDAARLGLNTLIDCVGEENVYIEVMDHGIAAEDTAIDGLVSLADEYGLPMVVTNDCHYTHEHDDKAHDAWLCLQSGKSGEARLDDPKRFRFNGHGYFMRTDEQMRALHDEGWWQEACDETVRLASRIDPSAMPVGHRRLPQFPVPDDFEPSDYVAQMEKVRLADNTIVPTTRADQYLYTCVREGAVKRYGSPLSADVKHRLREEFDVISGMGFSDYFLIVSDVIGWARSQGIAVGPGRGSAAGSLVSYCLEIVNVDPLRYHLLFERFLEPGRADMPDIDVDFEKGRRDEVLEYLSSRWGADMVAKIGTYSVSLSKKSLQSAARLLDRPDLNALSGKVPVNGGKPMPFSQLNDENNPASRDYRQALDKQRSLDDQYSPAHTVDDVLALAEPMEGTITGNSIHACGLIISDEPIGDLTPIRVDTRSTGDRAGYPITEWQGGELEAYGFLKMDVLGLRNLDIVTRACRSIRDLTGEDVSLETIPDSTDMDDPRVARTWELISAARTVGMFQMDSDGMVGVCEAVKPESMEDLSAVIALFRPGPLSAGMPQLYADRKWGRKDIDYSLYTDDVDEQEAINTVLGETFGCIVYQEQLMRLSTVVAGFDAMWRSKLRKAVGKKKRDLMEQVGSKFLADAQEEMVLPDGTIKPAFAESTAQALWDDFKGSADYLFNASHSYAYAQLAFVTAYLKANWPAAYGAALLALTDDPARRLTTLTALSAEGVTVLMPSVNTSLAHTAPVSMTDIAFGLSEVRDVGVAGEHIVAEREEGGRFTSLADVATRLSERGVNSKAILALIESGALDEFGPRKAMVRVYRALAKQPGLPVGRDEFGPLERARRQRHRIGLVDPNDHPVDNIELDLDYTQVGRVRQCRNGEAVTTLGVIRSWNERMTRAGTGFFARFLIEDSHTCVDGVAFNSLIMQLRDDEATPQPGDVVIVSGTVQVESDHSGDDDMQVRRTLKASNVVLVEVEDEPDEPGLSAPVDALVSFYSGPSDDSGDEGGAPALPPSPGSPPHDSIARATDVPVDIEVPAITECRESESVDREPVLVSNAIPASESVPAVRQRGPVMDFRSFEGPVVLLTRTPRGTSDYRVRVVRDGVAESLDVLHLSRDSVAALKTVPGACEVGTYTVSARSEDGATPVRLTVVVSDGVEAYAGGEAFAHGSLSFEPLASFSGAWAYQ